MDHTHEFHDQDLAESSSLLQISSAHLRAFLNISPDALILINQAGTIVMANEQASKLFGYSEQELSGILIEELLPHHFRQAHSTYRQQYFAAPRTYSVSAGLSLFGLCKDGTVFPVDISLRPLLLDGQLHALSAIRDMTVQQVAERERAEKAQELHLLTDLINLAPDAILLRDPLSRIMFWNRGAERLYGWEAQEVLGRITHSLLKTRFPESRASLDAILEQQGQWEGVLEHTRRDGSSIVVESRQSLVRDESGKPLAILEVNRDITERSRREQTEQAVLADVTKRETVFQQMLDALPNAVYLVAGVNARLLIANRAVSHIWGAQWQPLQPIEEFFRTNGITILDAQGRPVPEDEHVTNRALIRGETVQLKQIAIRHRDGTCIPVAVSARPLVLPPDVLHIPAGEPVALVSYQDISVLKEAEYLKDEFISVAAHELRTPLTGIKGYADRLLRRMAQGRDPPLSEWQQEALDEIKQATDRLSVLTEDLLDITRLQAGQLILQCSPTNIVPLVQRVAAQFQQTTSKHTIEVHASRETMIARVDPVRLEQIMTNLISNAIKYSPQGGPVVSTLTEEILSHQIQIRVQDKGIGIPRHQQAQIFGRFMRAENARAWRIEGTGLGLYLCRELVERLGGHLWFESEEKVGSTFFVTLPLEAC